MCVCVCVCVRACVRVCDRFVCVTCVRCSSVSYLGYLIALQLCVPGGGMVDAERQSAAEALRLLDHCLRE